MTRHMNNLPTIGWREWLALPDLGIQHIKAKIDTGARTSALHAFFVEPFEHKHSSWVRFAIHPLQKNTDFVVECEAPVKDKRVVTDSGGHKEHRYVIETIATLGETSWPVEITLTDRETMKFRMLLGRTAMAHHYLVNPSASYLIGKAPHKKKRHKALSTKS